MRKGSKWTPEQRAKIQPYIKSGWKHTEETKRRQSEAAIGKAKTKEARANMSRAWAGRSEEFKLAITERIKKIRPTKEDLAKGRYKKLGVLNPSKRPEVREKIAKSKRDHWDKVGRVDQTKRMTSEFLRFRMRMLVRDNFNCQVCGIKPSMRDTVLDHIKPYCLYPELLFSEDNVRTLCKACHVKTPTYGTKALTYKEEADTITP